MNRKTKQTWRQAAGFTLVELVVVIAIMGILGGVGAAGYGAYVKNAQKKADQTLVSNIIRSIEVGTNSTMFVNDDSFTKGATVYPVGVISLQKSDTDSCQVMASNSTVKDVTTACTMGEVTVVKSAEKQTKSNNLSGITGQISNILAGMGLDLPSATVTYYQNFVTETRSYCTAHTSLPAAREVYTDAEQKSAKLGFITLGTYWYPKGDKVSHIFAEDMKGIYELKDTSNGHGEGVNITQEELEATAGVSRVDVTTSGALYDSIVAAFGSTDSMKLQYDGWGKEQGDEQTYATLLTYSDNLVGNIKDTADLLTGTIKTLGLGDNYLSEDYQNSAQVMDSFANFLVAKYPEYKDWQPVWEAAKDGGDSYNFGLPDAGKYHNDYVYAATKGYNAAFASYCAANGMGGTEYEDYISAIEEFSGPPNAAGIDIDILPRMVNNAAFAAKNAGDSKSLYAKFLKVDAAKGEAVFDQVAGLYTKYLSSGICAKNGELFYDTMTSIKATGAEAYKASGGDSDKYFDYYGNYLQELAAFYQTVENQNGEGIMIVVTVENGEVNCQVSPASADLRNKG